MTNPREFVEAALPCLSQMILNPGTEHERVVPPCCKDAPHLVCMNCLYRPAVERAMRRYAAAVLREIATNEETPIGLMRLRRLARQLEGEDTHADE